MAIQQPLFWVPSLDLKSPIQVSAPLEPNCLVLMAHTLKSLPVDAAKPLHFKRSKVTALMTIHLLQEFGDHIKIRTRWFWINAPCHLTFGSSGRFILKGQTRADL